MLHAPLFLQYNRALGYVMLSTKSHKNRPNIHQKTALKFMLQFSSILEPTWLCFEKVWGTRWGPDGTKWLQKSIQKSIQKMIIFLITPGSIFERFWAPNSPPIGETNLPIFDVFSIMEPSWPQKPPKTPPRRLLEPPRPFPEPSCDRLLTILGSNSMVFETS